MKPDGWITRQEMPLPEDFERVEFMAGSKCIQGSYRSEWFCHLNGNECVHRAHVKAWRRLPQKPELPEFVKAFLRKWGEGEGGLFWLDVRDFLFDETKFPHLAVVEKPAEPWSITDAQAFAQLSHENRCLREQIKAREEAVNEIIKVFYEGANAGTMRAIAVYRRLLTQGDANS